MKTLAQRLQFARDHRRVPGQLSAYLDGELGARDRARVERHTGRCPQCRRLLAGLRATVALLVGQRSVRRPAPDQLISALRARLREPL